jgi:putative hemolysin
MRYRELEGISFANKLMQEFNVQFRVHNETNIPATGKLIIACNHPLGGFDGLALISLVSHYRKDIKFPVNDFLMNIPNLRDIFVPVNKVGSNSIQLARQFDEIFNSDNVILYFPAGICSRKINGIIQDVAWKKTFVGKAKEYRRDILPMHFSGQNSNFFYNLANLRKRLRIKVNLEMAYLADEFMHQRNSSYDIHVGDLIHYEALTSDKTNFEWAQEIRRYVYSLPKI